MDIQKQLEKVEALKRSYEATLEVEDANSHKAIQAFHLWHTSAVEFFASVLGVEEPLLQQFQPDGLERNGYVLQDVYHSILGTYAMLKVKANESNKSELNDIWKIMHPEVIRISKSRFESGFYADAVADAFKEIEVKVRRGYINKTGDDKQHGASLMQKAFSCNNNNPILRFKSSSEFSDGDIQDGYMHIFAGAMKAIRNPKSHENDTISKQDALRKLAFASMLMYKFDTIE